MQRKSNWILKLMILPGMCGAEGGYFFLGDAYYSHYDVIPDRPSLLRC